MKMIYKWLLLLAAVSGSVMCVMAQNTYSGYFLEDYMYRHQMNPAFGNEDGYVSFPVLGNLNLNMHGNLNLSDVVYNYNGKSVLFTNPNISAAEVMGNVGNRNKIGANINIDLISVGFKAFGGYNTVSLSANADVNASVPGSLFSLAKEGITNKTYDIKDLFANANGYATIALNHSHKIDKVEGLTVGATLKFYIGAGNVDFRLNNAHLTLGKNSWTAVTNGNVYASLSGLQFEHKVNDKTGSQYVSGANLDDGYGLNGFGMGLDLGAEYQWDDFKFSLAVLDLGFISWGKTLVASTNGDQTVDTDAYVFNVNDDAPNSFDNEWDRFTGDLAKLYELKDMGSVGSRTRALAATINAGVDYTFPLYRKLHFGLLNSTYINGSYSWTQFRLSANVNPVKMVSAGVNLAVGTYGAGFGWILNLKTGKGFNFFVGMDHTIGKLSKQFIPLKSNADFNLGINFPF